jgi:PAS domain S-box-containing protein
MSWETRYSLRWRLPLLIAALIILIVGTFLAVAYREVRGNLLAAAAARSQATADQLAGLMAQAAQQRLADMRRAAGQPSVRHLLESPSPETREAARASLSKLALNGAQLIEVWSPAGERMLAIPIPVSAADVLPGGPAPSKSGIAPLQQYRSTTFTEHVVEIPSETANAGPGAGATAPLGFVSVRRTNGAATTADLLNRLVGHGATIALGNKAGGVWTDLSKTVEPPPINLARGGVSRYRAADGRRHLGALADIHGTPWSIWVGFPDDVILAPAAAFLQRMLLIALGFVAIAVGVVAAVIGRITTPLHELTSASEAIAAGDYAHRVAIGRRDEIGRLSAAFNAMTEQVANAHRDLEERVRQRTARLEEASQLLAQRVKDARDAREELDRFFSLSLDLLCIADAEGRFTRVNPAWEETLGWSGADLTAKPYFEFVHPDDRASTEAAAAGLATGRAVTNFENRYRARDGSYRWLSWKAASQPTLGVIYATARDVTEQKRAARDLQQHMIELAAVNRELEAFSYSVSHDLRAPLRHITGFAMMLEESSAAALDAEGRRYLRTITDSARRMGRLIDDLLLFSRVGRAQLTRARVDLNDLVRDAQREVSADLNGRRVHWRIGDLPVVQGDPSLLRLVLVNLLSNALKYSATRPESHVEIAAAPAGDEMVVSVRDNGVGFDMQYADKLFGVFQRLHSADEFEGTGIGLANVRRIVQRHGGRTWAEGRVDGGATFYFSLAAEGA